MINVDPLSTFNSYHILEDICENCNLTICDCNIIDIMGPNTSDLDISDIVGQNVSVLDSRNNESTNTNEQSSLKSSLESQTNDILHNQQIF